MGKTKKLKTIEDVSGDAKIFIENFKINFEEATNLLKESGNDPSQSVLDQIQSLIIDMESNLRELEAVMNKTKEGQDYFLIKKQGVSDSLEMAQQEIILSETPFAEYANLKINFERFKKEAIFKFSKNRLEDGVYEE